MLQSLWQDDRALASAQDDVIAEIISHLAYHRPQLPTRTLFFPERPNSLIMGFLKPGTDTMSAMTKLISLRTLKRVDFIVHADQSTPQPP